MKAAIYHGVKTITIDEVDLPSPQKEYLLVEMKRCGICGSDLHSYFGFWEQPSTAHGHEVSGVVVQCGEGARGFSEGDRVCTEWFSHCGHCRFCRTGRYNLCEELQRTSGSSHAGFAEYVIAHQSSLFRLPDAVSFEEGALVEPLAVSYRAVRRCEEDGLGTLLVLGAGTIGLLSVAVARSSGSAAIISAARYDHQAAMAAELGATTVLRTGQDALGGSVVDGVMHATGGAGADAVIETTASASGLRDAFGSVRKGGVVVLVGGFHAPAEIDLKKVVDNEIRIIGSLCYSYSGLRRDFDWSIDLIRSGKVPAGRLVTHRFALEHVSRAMETAADKDTRSIKVQVCRPE